MKKLIYFLPVLVLLAARCKEKEPDEVEEKDKLRIELIPNYNGSSFSLNDLYTTDEGYTIQFTKLNIIFTKVKNGTNQLFESAVYRFDQNQLVWQGTGDYTKFSSLEGLLGVHEDENHRDPAARSLDDPLLITNTSDMHWGWNPGYIFLMIEGRADTTAAQTGDLDMTFLYHVGLDALLRDFSLSNVTWTKVNDNLHKATMRVNMAKIFSGSQTVDVKLENVSHTSPGQEGLSQKVIENFIEALTVD
jgi:hypothetical protein